MHQRNFVVFLATVVGLAALAVAIFVATAPSPSSPPAPLGGEGAVRGGRPDT
jgi:hypothetical protein